MKIRFELDGEYEWQPSEKVTIEAPNINVALLKLASNHDLSAIYTIYISHENEESDDDD